MILPMFEELARKIDWLAERLAGARHVVCLTGAGVSAESGVPTFRGPGGLWEGVPAEELATAEAFARDAAQVWRFYRARRKALLAVEPNQAHVALAELERSCPRFDLITQNVDGLHLRAGSRNIIALHGDIWIDRCMECGHEQRVVGVEEELPTCGQCGALVRPGVVWFGEMLPPGALEQAAACAAAADVMLVVGTSSVVQPAASLATWAGSDGATIVEINLEETPLSSLADATLRGKAGEILPRVVCAYRDQLAG